MKQQGKCIFNDIHSNYILKIIFHYLDKKTYCQIIRNNKTLQSYVFTNDNFVKMYLLIMYNVFISLIF